MFHVFVEGAVDDTPEGRARLADAIAKHYGLPAADLAARIERGRFRVKGNIDRATADLYVRDLGRLGARCAVEEANAANRANTPLPFPAVRPATPPAGLPTVPSRPTPPPSGLAVLGAPQAPSRPSTPPGGFQSGLAAAFAPQPDAAPANLGALENENVTFSLASVDGGDEPAAAAAPPASFAPPDVGSASIGPPPEKPKPEKKAKPAEAPLDMFAPPDAADDAIKFDVAEDELPKKRAATPPPVAEPEPPARASTPAMRRSQPIPVQGAPVDAPAARGGKLGPLADPKLRMVAGVVLAILIGFIPAHLYARAKEKSTFDAIDEKLVAAQNNADTPEMYAGLDKLRDNELARKESERRSIAIIALLLWGVVGGGLGYAWFRVIPWDRYE